MRRESEQARSLSFLWLELRAQASLTPANAQSWVLYVESVDLRSAIRKADAVLPAFARAGQRGDTLKRVARRGRCCFYSGCNTSE